jgi:hypothetical protein
MAMLIKLQRGQISIRHAGLFLGQKPCRLVILNEHQLHNGGDDMWMNAKFLVFVGALTGFACGALPDTEEDCESTCTYPTVEYSSHCDEVEQFQCGLEVSCVNGRITANWHEHIACNGRTIGECEKIENFSCTYNCRSACLAAEGQPASTGSQMIELNCAQQ